MEAADVVVLNNNSVKKNELCDRKGYGVLYGNLLLGIYGNKMFKRDNPPKGVLQAYYISIHARNDVPCLLFLSGALWMDLN